MCALTSQVNPYTCVLNSASSSLILWFVPSQFPLSLLLNYFLVISPWVDAHRLFLYLKANTSSAPTLPMSSSHKPLTSPFSSSLYSLSSIPTTVRLLPLINDNWPHQGPHCCEVQWSMSVLSLLDSIDPVQPSSSSGSTLRISVMTHSSDFSQTYLATSWQSLCQATAPVSIPSTLWGCEAIFSGHPKYYHWAILSTSLTPIAI